MSCHALSSCHWSVLWPITFLINMLTALKESRFYFYLYFYALSITSRPHVDSDPEYLML